MDYEFTDYQESMGSILWPEGFAEELAGRTIPEQLHCYGWSKLMSLTEVPYTELEDYINAKRWEYSYLEPVKNTCLILRDGLVVGVVVVSGPHREYILPYKGYVYASTSDNNGAGYKETEWSKYLVCLPFSHTMW